MLPHSQGGQARRLKVRVLTTYLPLPGILSPLEETDTRIIMDIHRKGERQTVQFLQMVGLIDRRVPTGSQRNADRVEVSQRSFPHSCC
jgi:hypothetical protein